MHTTLKLPRLQSRVHQENSQESKVGSEDEGKDTTNNSTNINELAATSAPTRKVNRKAHRYVYAVHISGGVEIRGRGSLFPFLHLSLFRLIFPSLSIFLY